MSSVLAPNDRLADAIYLWAFASLTCSPGARAFYDARRAAGDTHHAALRVLGNRLVSILHGCLATTPPMTSPSLGGTVWRDFRPRLDISDRGMSSAALVLPVERDRGAVDGDGFAGLDRHIPAARAAGHARTAAGEVEHDSPDIQ